MLKVAKLALAKWSAESSKQMLDFDWLRMADVVVKTSFQGELHLFSKFISCIGTKMPIINRFMCVEQG